VIFRWNALVYPALGYIQHWHDGERQMPRYYFDLRDGCNSVDTSGATFRNDRAAIERAKAVAIVVSIDKPMVDPTRYISVQNETRAEISRVPVYSKPSAVR
jgi:uncharacterized protein DUF6894